MADADLEEIRKARLQQLQQEKGGGGGSSGGDGGDSGQEEQRKQQEAEARANILSQILEAEAADRLNRIRLVKESRATDVENRLIMLAKSGQLRQKVNETQLKEILNAVSEQHKTSDPGMGKIVVNRRKGWDDEDDDLLDGL